MRYFVEVHAAGMVPERHALPEDQASFGSALEASIRSPAADRLTLPLLIFAVLGDCVTVQFPERIAGSVTFRGEATRSAAVPWGEDVYVGGARLAFVAESGRRKGPSGAVLAAVLFALLAGAAIVLGSSDRASPTASDLEPPQLFKMPTSCPEPSADAAGSHAAQLLGNARAMKQRAPFDRGDGVRALKLLGEAKVCFELAGRVDDAVATEQERARWQDEVDEEYAALRLRLRVALDQKRFGDALSALRGLEGLLASQAASPYRTWLANLRRDLERRTSQAGS